VTETYLPISRHDEQKHRAGDLIDAGKSKIYFAQNAPKRPISHNGCSH